MRQLLDRPGSDRHRPWPNRQNLVSQTACRLGYPRFSAWAASPRPGPIRMPGFLTFKVAPIRNRRPNDRCAARLSPPAPSSPVAIYRCRRWLPVVATNQMFVLSTALCTLVGDHARAAPSIVAIERQSGVVSDICSSGEASNAFSTAASRFTSSSSFASFSLSRVLVRSTRFRRLSPAAVGGRSGIELAHVGWPRSLRSASARWILPCVKLLSRLLTALNLLPSMATLAFANRPILRHNSTNCAQTFLIAGPLSLRKSAMAL